MKNIAVVLVLAVGALNSFAQPAPARGGRGGGAPAAPPVASLSQRPPGSGLGTIRAGAADNNIWFGWRVAIPTSAFKGLTFSEALPKADTLGVASVEVSSSQKAALEVPKNFDYRLQTGERNAINQRLRELNEQILAYRVDDLASDEGTRRKVFEFAKAVGAPLIITGPEPAAIEALEKLANEFEINVALESKKDPKGVLGALEGRGKRMGLAADLGGWM